MRSFLAATKEDGYGWGHFFGCNYKKDYGWGYLCAPTIRIIMVGALERLQLRRRDIEGVFVWSQLKMGDMRGSLFDRN